jgi:hypothetical protein
MGTRTDGCTVIAGLGGLAVRGVVGDATVPRKTGLLRIERGRTMNLLDEASFLSFRGGCPIQKLGADADLLGVLVDRPVPRGAGAATIGSSFG